MVHGEGVLNWRRGRSRRDCRRRERLGNLNKVLGALKAGQIDVGKLPQGKNWGGSRLSSAELLPKVESVICPIILFLRGKDNDLVKR